MISVAMASYNGEKFIAQQIKTILENLSDDDELIISDDGSTDNTLSIIESFNDKRIHVVKGPRKGINMNFANAVSHCSGEYIFFSDQDDIWYPNKKQTVVEAFKSNNCLLVQHDAKVTDAAGNVLIESFAKHRRVRPGLFKNFIRNTYHGCCMAISSELKSYIVPFPKSGCFFDYWIGLIANIKGKTVFIDNVLMEYKRYDNNASSFEQYPRLIQLKNRFLIFCNLLLYFLHSKKRI